MTLFQVAITSIAVTFIFDLLIVSFYKKRLKKRLQKEIEIPKVGIAKRNGKFCACFTYKGQSFTVIESNNKPLVEMFKECLEEMFEEQKQDIIDKI